MITIEEAIKRGLATVANIPCPNGWAAATVKVGSETVYIFTHPDCPELKNEITPEV